MERWLPKLDAAPAGRHLSSSEPAPRRTLATPFTPPGSCRLAPALATWRSCRPGVRRAVTRFSFRRLGGPRGALVFNGKEASASRTFTGDRRLARRALAVRESEHPELDRAEQLVACAIAQKHSLATAILVRPGASGFTKTGKSHTTCRGVISLLHPAGSTGAARAPLSFGDEHFRRREQRPAWRGKARSIPACISQPSAARPPLATRPDEHRSSSHPADGRAVGFGHMRSRSRPRLPCPRARTWVSTRALRSTCSSPDVGAVFPRSRLRRVHMRRGAHRQLDIAAPCDRDARGPSERPTCRALRVWAGCCRSSSVGQLCSEPLRTTAPRGEAGVTRASERESTARSPQRQ